MKKSINNKQKRFIENRGITLVALVITIIVMLLLVGVSVNLIMGKQGIVTRAIQAKEESEISAYQEKIELIRADLYTKNENNSIPTILEMQTRLKEEKWIKSIEIIMDNGIEKLKITTKEGYIFYITQTEVEYKGKGKVVDTSALEKEDVLELKITTTTENGRMVKITDLTGKSYYKIQYQIGSEDGEWTEIQSGNEVEVPFAQIIYARLYYGTNYGITYRLSIAHTDPKITLSTDDYSNITRKTDIPLSDIFQVTWGSEGVGKCYYTVSGTLKFNNTKVTYNTNSITNLSQLELGTYTITCGVATPTQVENNEATYGGYNITVTISKLANTTVANLSDENVEAYAIYSEYDLAYFRDLVNNGQNSINAKIMNDIDLDNVCDWNPIGAIKNDITITEISSVEYISYFGGIFDGDKKNISNLRFNNLTATTSFGLFGAVKNGIIKNCIIKNSNIKGCKIVGTIAGYVNNTKIINCLSSGNIQGGYCIGGLVGLVDNNSEIYTSKNESIITTNEGNNYGGIAGAINNSIINYCYNIGNIKGTTISCGPVRWNYRKNKW